MNLKNHKRNSAAVVAEALESRKLVSGSVTVSGGVMTVNGTEGADQVYVNVANRNIAAKINGQVFPIYNNISRIIINLKGGNDYCRSYSDLPNSVDGGAGNDTILTAWGNDTLIGGTGNDNLDANGGNDLIRGGDGDDSLFGCSGSDVLYGDAGNDSLVGGADNDTLVGGVGRDTLDGQGGRDYFDAQDGQAGDRIWFRPSEDAASRWDRADILV